jgi:hypothetical protein
MNYLFVLFVIAYFPVQFLRFRLNEQSARNGHSYYLQPIINSQQNILENKNSQGGYIDPAEIYRKIYPVYSAVILEQKNHFFKQNNMV